MNIVITGASRGIGKAIAECFGGDKQGHTLLLSALHEQPLNDFGKQLQGRYPRANVYTYACDLSLKEQAASFADWCFKHCIPDVVINNAGSFLPGGIHNEEEGTLKKMLDVNLFSAYYLTRALLPEMMKRKSGHIFNISSIAGIQAYENGGSYSVSKFALAGFSKNLREEMKPYNIKVSTLYPGAVYTDSWAGAVPKNRIMEARDIAEMIYTMAHLSPQACVEEVILRPQLGDL